MKSFGIRTGALALAVVVMAGPARAGLEDWELGLKGGWNSTSLRGDEVGLWLNSPKFQIAGTVSDYQGGGVVGGYARRYISDMWAIQVEALYTQKGGKGNVFGDGFVEFPSNVSYPAAIDGVLTVETEYVEFPVLAVIMFPADDSENLTLSVLGGVAFGLNTSSDLRFEGTAEVRLPDSSRRVVRVDEKVDIKAATKDADIGGVIGLALELDRSRVRLLFDARWTFGLMSIDDTGSDSDVRNNTLSFTIGAGFPLGD